MTHPVLATLASEVRDTSSHAIYIAHNDEALGGELARVTATQPAPTGQQARRDNARFSSDRQDLAGRTKRTHSDITRSPSTTPTKNALKPQTAKAPSTFRKKKGGRKRTTNEATPTYGENYVNLGTADRCYAAIENEPSPDGETHPENGHPGAVATADLQRRQQSAHRGGKGHATAH